MAYLILNVGSWSPSRPTYLVASTSSLEITSVLVHIRIIGSASILATYVHSPVGACQVDSAAPSHGKWRGKLTCYPTFGLVGCTLYRYCGIACGGCQFGVIFLG